MQKFVGSLSTAIDSDANGVVRGIVYSADHFDSVWNPISQKNEPLAARIALLSILVEFVKGWRTALQTPLQDRELRVQVLSCISTVEISCCFGKNMLLPAICSCNTKARRSSCFSAT